MLGTQTDKLSLTEDSQASNAQNWNVALLFSANLLSLLRQCFRATISSFPSWLPCNLQAQVQLAVAQPSHSSLDCSCTCRVGKSSLPANKNFFSHSPLSAAMRMLHHCATHRHLLDLAPLFYCCMHTVVSQASLPKQNKKLGGAWEPEV